MRELENQLRMSRESLAFALESGRMGSWDINLENNNIACSPEMLKIWEISENEFRGERSELQMRVHPEDRAPMVELLNEAIRARSVYEMEYRLLFPDGKIKWVISRGRCTYAPNSDTPVRIAGVVFDVTEKKIKEEALNKAIQAREQFFMIASHELKTPITCLDLQIEVLQWEIQNSMPKIAEKEIIQSSLKKQRDHLLRLSRLVDNILSESRMAGRKLSLNPEYFNLHEMVQEVLERFKVTSQLAGVEILLSSDKEISGRWDKFRLEQVVLNLLMNAIKYGNQKPILIKLTQDENEATIIVKDQGIGIKPEDQSRIFDRFERVVSDKKINGLGLGLYISNSIVKAHGGEIRVKSTFGEGSEFTVALPL